MHSEPHPHPSPPARWVRWLAASYLVVQVVVPAIQLTAPRPARFGWQMYSAVRALDVFVVSTDGDRVAVDPELVDAGRADLDPLDRLVPTLCARPGVAAVAVVARSTGEERSRRCP